MKKILLLSAMCCLAFSAGAQLLWKVSGNGADKDSYIFGTHHVAPASMIDSVAGLRAAIALCDAVYGEVASDDMMNPEAQQAMAGVMMASADSTLTALLSPAQQDSVNAVLSKYTNGQLSLSHVAMLKPAALVAQLGMMQSMVAFPGFDPAAQLDVTVQALAKKLGKPAHGFESLMWQAQLLFGDPVSEQIGDLMDAIAKDDRAAEYAHRLAAAYMGQNLEAISDILFDPEMGMDDKELDKMVNDRNASWVNILIGLLPTSAILVCVGVGHLPGENGLINLLRNAGFSVTPVE